jgi:predicted branched-subunit amino acid permease
MVVGMVCLRLLLIGASLRPWLGGASPAKIYPTLYLLTDSSWIVALRYRAQGGADPNFLVGSGVVTWITWVLSAAPGYWLGASLADPQRYGLDLVMPVFFVAMMVPIWRGLRAAIGWLVAAIVSLIAYRYLGGWWYVPLGAIAGSVTGGLINVRK